MGNGKRKIEMKKIEDEKSKMVAFSKRRKGLFKKAAELSCLSGAKIAVKVFSPAGKPFSFDDHHLISSINHVPENPPQRTGADDHVITEATSCTEIVAQWVNNLNVETLYQLDDLLMFKQQLEVAKDMLLQQEEAIPC